MSRFPEEPSPAASGESPALSTAAMIDRVCAPLERRPGGWWWIAFLAAASGALLLLSVLSLQLAAGLGILGINHPVAWGGYIVNFVFWVGIAHAGTLISAILLVMRQRWRLPIARSAEAMTIMAIACAAIFPLLHTGRPWLDGWLLPLPNERGPLWPQFRSPLAWDVFAVGTYATVSLLFWYLSLVPDLAIVRDRLPAGWRRRLYHGLSLGWSGTLAAWTAHHRASLQLAWLAMPLVVSVHSTVSFDFAMGNVPGWHATVFPPYFVVGAIFGGFAMLVLVLIPLRAGFGLQALITRGHLERCAFIILATSQLLLYAYLVELFAAWQSGPGAERDQFLWRMAGSHAWTFWLMILCNAVAPLLLAFSRLRRHLGVLAAVCVLVNLGMWLERYTIVVGSLERAHLPSAWGSWLPTLADLGVTFGTFGLFAALFLLVVRWMPAVGMHEVAGGGGEQRHG